jgi:hypothetical protein
MRIDKILRHNKIGILKIVSESIVLEQGNAGRAIFAVQSPGKLDGMVTLSLGVAFEYKRYFTGYIESCQQIDGKQQRLIVREPAAVLAKRWPLSLRNTTALEVLNTLNAATGCAFKVGAGAWTLQPIPHFINIGSGFEALKLLGRELGVEDFTWLSQADGTIYVGALADAEINRKTVAVCADFFTNVSASGADCPVVPGFRPGKRVRLGNGEALTIDSITVSGEKMRINWQ